MIGGAALVHGFACKSGSCSLASLEFAAEEAVARYRATALTSEAESPLAWPCMTPFVNAFTM